MSKEMDEVRAVAETFFARMVEWEKRSHVLFPARGAVREDLRGELQRIFSDHLTHKTASKQRRYVAMHYANPPEFARPMTKVEAAEPGAYWVYVDDWLKGQTRFHFVQRQGAWKIDCCQIEGGDGNCQKQSDI